ncbi:hypothetical protein K443DRAFT_598311 [Laccaria amethystina LaAM-08-1]|uniref:Uncharacterized protein n=1 Tax=Laccaria amethystina LaAM-08-1 TaxID=1095629 RepID=A0A0C9XSB3_9AGAR|nr:hypothetical protein K443DRAFT_598311 [Laccaria amethystina LaAM-08-1]
MFHVSIIALCPLYLKAPTSPGYSQSIEASRPRIGRILWLPRKSDESIGVDIESNELGTLLILWSGALFYLLRMVWNFAIRCLTTYPCDHVQEKLHPI